MLMEFTTATFAARQERLRAELGERRLPWLLVTSLTNIFYLTGFRGSAGVALFGASDGRLWVDPRYTLQAREQARTVEVLEERRGILRGCARWLHRRKVRKVAYEPAHLTCAEFDALSREAGTSLRWIPAGGLVEEMRAVKDPGEIQRIRAAGQVTASVFEGLLGQVRPGVRESDLAAEIEYCFRQQGAEGAAFETIVASGARAALPHARSSPKLLEKNELVIFDLGAIVQGYAADMTRTVFLGEPSRRVRALFAVVLRAQQEALEACRVEAPAGSVDAAARRALAHQGVDRWFTHSTGHGVGLEVHEGPRLGRGEKARLRSGCVVTVEPGVYLEGFGGIRIEDTVLVGPADPEILTPATKVRWTIA